MVFSTRSKIVQVLLTAKWRATCVPIAARAGRIRQMAFVLEFSREIALLDTLSPKDLERE